MRWCTVQFSAVLRIPKNFPVWRIILTGSPVWLSVSLFSQWNISYNYSVFEASHPGPRPTTIKTNRQIWTWCLLSLLSEDRGMHEYSLDTIIDDRLTCNTSLSVTKLQHWLPHCSRNELELRSSGCSQNTSFGHNLNWETAPWRPERSSLVSWREIRNRNMNIKYYLSGDKVGKVKPSTKHWFGWIKLCNPSFSGSLAHNKEPWKLGLILKNDQKYRVSFFSKYFPLMFW